MSWNPEIYPGSIHNDQTIFHPWFAKLSKYYYVFSVRSYCLHKYDRMIKVWHKSWNEKMRIKLMNYLFITLKLNLNWLQMWTDFEFVFFSRCSLAQKLLLSMRSHRIRNISQYGLIVCTYKQYATSPSWGGRWKSGSVSAGWCMSVICYPQSF